MKKEVWKLRGEEKSAETTLSFESADAFIDDYRESLTTTRDGLESMDLVYLR